MGKFYAKVINITPLETRTKKDGSGTYEFAALDLQPYDAQSMPMTHETWDWQTGQSRGQQPDIIRYDCVREKAKELQAQNFQTGETVYVETAISPNKYGHTEVNVLMVQHVQADPQPQVQARTYAQSSNPPYGQYR